MCSQALTLILPMTRVSGLSMEISLRYRVGITVDPLVSCVYFTGIAIGCLLS